MKICIDARCLIEGRRTGVEEYTRYLLDNLFAIDQKNEYVLFLNSWKKTQADFSWTKKYPNVTLKKFRFPNKLLNFMFWYLGSSQHSARNGIKNVGQLPQNRYHGKLLFPLIPT